MIKLYLSVLSLSLVLLISGCGKKETSTTDNKPVTKSPDVLAKQGKDIFYGSTGVNSVTNLACAHCHSDGTNDATYPLTKYHSNIKNANLRTQTYLGKFKGEDVKKTAGGATVCWEQYLKFKEPMTAEQIASLNAYYELVGKGEPVKDMVYTTIALPTQDKEKLKKDQEEIAKLTGDKAKGEEVFNGACKFCHGDGTKVKSVPSLFRDFDGNLKSITFMSRFGKKYMPFFSYESISNQDMANVVAYIMSNQEK